jgi:penicillin-binding protein 1A
MAHAYETFATGGVKVYNSVLGDNDPKLGRLGQGPIGIHSIGNFVNHPQYDRVLQPDIAHEVGTMLEGPIQQGTATEAAIPGVVISGKTGTTSNYGDAWFVGWTPQMTVAVWVGFPNKLIPMSTLYNGGPVEGGTYPAIIWRTFMEQAIQILAQEAAAKKNGQTTTTTTPVLTTGVTPAPTSTVGTSTTPAATTPAATTPATGGNTTTPTQAATPAPTGNTGAGTTGGNTGGGTGGTTGGTTGGNTGGGTGGATGGTTGGTGLGGGGTTGH